MKQIPYNCRQSSQGENFLFKNPEGDLFLTPPSQTFGKEFDQLSFDVWKNRDITNQIKFRFLIDPTNPPILSSVKIQQVSAEHPVLKRIYKELTPFSIPIFFLRERPMEVVELNFHSMILSEKHC